MAENLQTEINELKTEQKKHLARIAELEAENERLRDYGERLIAAIQEAVKQLPSDYMPFVEVVVQAIKGVN